MPVILSVDIHPPADGIAYGLFFRFPLSLRMVEEMLAGHGVDVICEDRDRRRAARCMTR